MQQNSAAKKEAITIATHIDVEKDLAKNHGHLTVTAAARLAQKSGVKQLLLHHVSRRYHPKDVQTEAQAILPNTVVVNDFEHF